MSAPAVLRFGLIGTDSPHAASFARLLGDGRSGAVAGATVVAAWEHPTIEDFPLSERGTAGAETLDGLGVPLLDSPEAVAEVSDVILIVVSDSRQHPALFLRLARFGKPIYVDTRFAPTVPEAIAMLDAAVQCGTLVHAGSPKRFSGAFLEARRRAGIVTAVELRGPLPEQPGHPCLAWYGVHLVDLAVACFGHGVQSIVEIGNSFELTWSDGRTAAIGGPSEWSPITLGTLRTMDDTPTRFEIIAGEPMLTGLLSAVISGCRSGTPIMPYAEILDIVKTISANPLQGSIE